MNANEKEFEKKLKLLDDLYEEGKDCLNHVSVPFGDCNQKKLLRAFEILFEMRNIAATQMKAIHDVPQN